MGAKVVSLPIDETELRRRLAEAEETLRAIRDGDVDAVVASDEVFALGGQDSYRVFMEAMDLGAAALDADGRVVYVNAALAKLLGKAAEALQGEDILTVLGDGAGRTVRSALPATQERHAIQVELRRASGVVFLDVSISPLSLAFGPGYALTFTDVTERIEALAAGEGDRVGRAIMASSPEAVVVCDAGGTITHANAKVRTLQDRSVVGLQFEDAFPLVLPLGTGLVGGGDLVDVALSGNVLRNIEATFKSGDRDIDLLLHAAPLRQMEALVGGCVITLADVTERRRSERLKELLVHELTHRVKNTLTLVLSIANRTAASVEDLTGFRQAFSRRILALAETHSLLTRDAWRGVTLRDLAATELAPFVTIDSPRAQLDGLDLEVSPEVAVPLGLIIHELVTNAVKYGALSNETGAVRLTARTLADASVALTWEERGGPEVRIPEKSGFGQKLIQRGLGQRGDKATVVDFRPDGVVCRMYLPPPPET